MIMNSKSFTGKKGSVVFPLFTNPNPNPKLILELKDPIKVEGWNSTSPAIDIESSERFTVFDLFKLSLYF